MARLHKQAQRQQRPLPRLNNLDDIVVVARIGAAYGVRGWAHVQSYTDPPDNLLKYPLHRQSKGDSTSTTSWQPVAVTLKRHKQAFIAKFAGVETREDAALLRGQYLGAQAKCFTDVEHDEVLWRDLVGLRVSNKRGFEFGIVHAITETGNHDVLVIRADEGGKNETRETLIPFAEQYIEALSLEDRTLVVDWDENW